MSQHRAYSLFEIKSFDEETRTVEGIASTPEIDRGGDEMDSKGAVFVLPMPFKWQHKEAVGNVIFAAVTDAGIRIKAVLPKIAEPGLLKEQVDYAWQSMKHGLTRGLSIGWRPIEAKFNQATGGLKVAKWEWFETSAVDIPMNASATITLIKSADAPHLAAIGTEVSASRQSAGDSASRVVRTTTRKDRTMKKTITEQIKEFENTRAAKSARLEEIQTKAVDEGRSKDESEREEFKTLKADIESIDAELVDLRDMEKMNLQKAVPVAAATPEEASRSRGGYTHVRVQENLPPPGIGFARVAIAKMASFMAMKSGNMISAAEIAKQRWPHDSRLQAHFKTAVAGGLTTDTNWATELVEPTTLDGEFIEFLRAQTLVNRLGLKSLPFNVRIPRQTTGGTGYWVGEGKPKPLTKFHFDAVTLPYTKVAAIAVITQELARFSRPDAEGIVRDQIARAIVERYDTDFIDPAKAVSSGVNPASVTNGLTALSSAGTSADNIRTDIANLLEAFILNNINPSGVKLIMPNTLALAASLMVTTNGVPQFPGLTMNGGTLLGIPVIPTQYAASGASFGNMVIAIDTNAVGLAQDPTVSVDVSGEASLQMDDAPTNDASTGTGQSLVSMFQTNSLAIRAEQFIHWVKLRSNAVVYMDDVNWGAIGSPF